MASVSCTLSSSRVGRLTVQKRGCVTQTRSPRAVRVMAAGTPRRYPVHTDPPRHDANRTASRTSQSAHAREQLERPQGFDYWSSKPDLGWNPCDFASQARVFVRSFGPLSTSSFPRTRRVGVRFVLPAWSQTECKAPRKDGRPPTSWEATSASGSGREEWVRR